MILHFLANRETVKTTTYQRSQLESEFSHRPYMTQKRRQYLSTKLGLRKHEIYVWFKHRRNHIPTLEAQINWNGNLHLYSPTYACSVFHSACFFVNLLVCLSLIFCKLFFLFDILKIFVSFCLRICNSPSMFFYLYVRLLHTHSLSFSFSSFVIMSACLSLPQTGFVFLSVLLSVSLSFCLSLFSLQNFL